MPACIWRWPPQQPPIAAASRAKVSDEAVCLRNLHLDWEAHSGNRIAYAALGALAPLPLIWLMAYAIMSGRREAKPRRYDMKVFPAKSVA